MGQLMSISKLTVFTSDDGIVRGALSSGRLSHKKLELIFAYFRKIYNDRQKLKINVDECKMKKILLHDMLVNNNSMNPCQTLSPELKASVVKYWCEVHLRYHLRNNQASQEWI